uniref:D-beta-hydroxybutyrate dehydrogenase, mitochondrial n=1 Tax=Naja naja TaxID=35670 RepID=A0A8C6XIA0_NAJNA
MHVLQLDVCCEQQVARALQYVEARLEDPARGNHPGPSSHLPKGRLLPADECISPGSPAGLYRAPCMGPLGLPGSVWLHPALWPPVSPKVSVSPFWTGQFLWLEDGLPREGEEAALHSRPLTKSLLSCGAGLWGLVNNAGISSFGDVEFTSVEKYQRVADINLWGTLRVTKAFLPLIRRARGRIVNMSSMLGRMARPMRSSYCISKFGLEAFSDCLRQEMYRWGVSVVAIEPSNFIAATGILTPEGIEAEAECMWRGASEAVRADYGEADFQEKLSRMKGFAHSGLQDVSPVLDALTEALAARRPCSRYTPMEASWWLRLQAATHLPSALADWLFVS